MNLWLQGSLLLLCLALCQSAPAPPMSASLAHSGFLLQGAPMDGGAASAWSVSFNVKLAASHTLPAAAIQVITRPENATIERVFGDLAVERLIFADAGVEHTLTLNRGPSSAFSVDFDVRVQDVCSAQLVGGNLEFKVGAKCDQTFRYEKLAVVDANGRQLAARMTCAAPAQFLVVSRATEGECDLQGGALTLSLELLENSGAYPIVIDPFIATAYPIGALSTTLFSVNGGSARDYFGAQVGLGNIHGNNNGYNDIVVSAPGYNSKSGRIMSFRNSNGAIATSFTTDLTNAGSCSGASYGRSMAVGRASAADSFDSVYSGTNWCNAATIWRGASPNPTRANSYTSYNCISFAFGPVAACSNFNTPDWALAASLNFYINHAGVSSPFSSPVSTTRKPGWNIYTDYTVNYLLLADPVADTDIVRWGGAVALTTTGGATINIVRGSQRDGGFGRGLGFADVNGDSRPDVLIGANHMDSSSRINVGALYVYTFSTSANRLNDANNAAFSWFGEQDNEECGHSVSNAGDLNKDGFADVVIGCPYYSSSSSTMDGRIILFNGAANAAQMSVAQVIYSGVANSFFGFSLPGMLRDLDNDNYNDIAVGMPGTSSFAGRVVAFKSIRFASVTVSIGTDRASNTISTSIAAFNVVVRVTNAGPEATTPGLNLVFTFPSSSWFNPTVSSGISFQSDSVTAVLGASIPAGTTSTFTLGYTLSNTVLYPTTVTFGVRSVVNAPNILIASSSSVTFTLVNPVTVAFSDPSVPRPIAFQEASNAADTSVPLCVTQSGANACPVVKGKVVVVRRFGFTNQGPATAFANQLTITYPDGVFFSGIRLVATRVLANLTTLGWSCSEPRSRTTICVFPNLASGAQLDSSPFELFFTTPTLAQGGAWQFAFTFATSSSLQSALTATTNQLLAPTTSCDVSILSANTGIVRGGACCGGASNQVCSGDNFDVAVYATNQGLFSSASTVIFVTVPTPLVTVGVPRVFYDGSSGTSSLLCTAFNATAWRCPVPGDTIEPSKVAYVRLTLSLGPSVAANVDLRVFSLVTTTTTQTSSSNDGLVTTLTSCQLSSWRVQMDLLNLPVSSLYTPLGKPVYQVSLTNNGPSDYSSSAGTQFRLAYGSGLSIVTPLNAGGCTGSSSVSCSIPSVSRYASVRFNTTVALASTDLSSFGYTRTINSTADIVGFPTTAFSRTVTFKDDVSTAVSISLSPSDSVAVDSVIVASVDVKNVHPTNNATNVLVNIILPFAVGSLTSANFSVPSDANRNCKAVYQPDPNDFQAYTTWNVTCLIPLLVPFSSGCASVAGQRCQYTLTIVGRTVTAPTLTASTYATVTTWPFFARISGDKPDTDTLKADSQSVEMTTRPDLLTSLTPSFAGNAAAKGEKYSFTASVQNIGFNKTTATIDVSITGVGATFDGVPSISSVLSCVSSFSNSTKYTCSVANFVRNSITVVNFGISVTGNAGQVFQVRVGASSSVAELPNTLNDNVKISEYTINEAVMDLVTSVRTTPRNPYTASDYQVSVEIRNIGIGTARAVSFIATNWPNHLLNRTLFYYSSSSVQSCNIPNTNSSTTLTCTLNATIVPNGVVRVELYTNTTLVNGTAIMVFSASDASGKEVVLVNNNNTVFMTSTTNPKFITTIKTGSSSGSTDSGSLIAAIVVPIVGSIIIGLALWKLGFFKRREKPPALDAQGNYQVHDDD